MGQQANILARGHEAFNQRDFEALQDCLADDVRWHVGGRTALAGTYQGRDALMRDYFHALRDAPVRIRTEHTLADGDRIMSSGSLDLDLGGETRAFPFMEDIRLRDGKICERRGFVHDQQGLDELLAQLPRR